MLHAVSKNTIRESGARKTFRVFNVLFLTLICVVVVIPIWNVLITSLAKDQDVMGGVFLIVPPSLTFQSYARVLHSGYMRGFWNSMYVALIGTACAMTITVPLGFALAQKRLIARNFFMKLVSLTLVFDAGIMPLYVLIRSLGLIDNRWSLILPFMLSSFNLIIVKNFMMSIPESFVESAWLDGCNDLMALVRIVIPMSVPILAAVTLFYFVSFWNRYTEAVMFINNSSKYTLQVMLRALIYQSDGSLGEGNVVYDNTKMAVMVLGMLPVMLIYPFVQRHFVSGLMLGGVKG
ncbi:MAG: carbohydrate ABC transporter permease [Clostridia bacterium]|nr:carbohydrate ABC transporter permease [Clostridia bacterium]